MKKQRKAGSVSVGVLVVAAGSTLALVGASTASARNMVRGQVGWGAMGNAGYLGGSVTIGQVEVAHPNPNHITMTGAVKMQLSWPWRPTPDINNFVPGTRNWYSTHATAAASELVGNGATIGVITGIAPESSLITASIANGINLSGNATEATETALVFALFALGDQPFANRIADAMGVERWTTATVICAPFARSGSDLLFRYGEDSYSRCMNAAATMTGALIVCPIGDDGLAETEIGMNEIGNILSPGGAHNVLAVGRLDADGEDRDDNSSIGPIPAQEWAVLANLISPKTPPDAKPPPPTEPIIYETRPGASIMAPGTNITLAGSLLEAYDAPSTTSYGEFWSGTSFSSAVVAGAAALLQDAGNQLDLWVTGRPSALVTKACIINSATKMGFNNGAQPDDNGVVVTTRGLDPEVGSGNLSILRIYRQFVLADTKDVRKIAGFTVNAMGEYTLEAFGTDPRVPFVTQWIQPPIILANEPTAPTRPNGELYDDPGAVVFPQQFDDRFPNNPPSGGGGGGGREGPFDEGWVPPAPGPGRPGSGGGGSDGTSNVFKTGWDHGNLGQGFIDIPIGFVPEGSRILATLCWNRTERWALPNFAGPLSFIDPALCIAPGFVQPRSRAVAAPREPVSPLVSLGWENHTILPSVDAHGHLSTSCKAGARGAVISTPDGRLMTEQAADKIVDDLREKLLTGELVRFGQKSASRGQVALGLDIQFIATPEVAANPAFVEGLERASALWESLIDDNIVVTMAVGFTSGQGFIAAASSAQVGDAYPVLRAMMIDDASADELGLLFALPQGSASFETAGGIFSTDDFGFVRFTTANAKALGYEVPTSGGGKAPPPDGGTVPGGRGIFNTNADAAIVFNTDFTFDTNPDDGLTPGSVDVVFVMIHELGHALGFISGVDGGFSPTALDLFRMGIDDASNNPATLQDFTLFTRELRKGTEAALDSVNGLFGVGEPPVVDPISENWPYRFSTGTGVGGDGRQASHWKDDSLLGLSQVIGVMDPTYNPAQNPDSLVTVADLVAFSVIGWDINFQSTEAGDPMQVPVIRFSAIGGAGGENPAIDVMDIGREFEFENLDLELYRLIPGFGNRLIAASRTTECNVEHINIQGQNGGLADIVNAQYSLRIQYVGPRVDFGGYTISGYPSLPREGYRDLPDAQVEYGLAWYVEEVRQVGQPIVAPPEDTVDRSGDMNRDGEVNATDLAMLLAVFGTSNPSADLNADGRVDSADLAELIGRFSRPN